jgi:hypothetical protein
VEDQPGRPALVPSRLAVRTLGRPALTGAAPSTKLVAALRLETTFEVPRGDALVEHVATLLPVVGLLLARSVNVFSSASIARSASVKPVTATEMR